MNRIGKTLKALLNEKRKALVAYIVSGDPSPGVTLAAMHALVDGGADIIELGIPFSDPMAEGPVIQKGHERALAHRTSLSDTLKTVSSFREKNSRTPIVLMGYFNPIERMGHEMFARRAAQAGVDGVLTVDLPLEENQVLDCHLREYGIDNILLIAPTTSKERVKRICESVRGFVYYVSFKGVTGADSLDLNEISENVSFIKAATPTPVLVGFGIKDADSARNIAQFSDGVVVGSALVKLMGGDNKPVSRITSDIYDLVSAIRRGIDGSS